MTNFLPSIEKFIYCELFQNKTIEFYLSRKASKIRIRNRWADFFIVVFSTGGVMGWKMWDNAPSLACVLISIVSLVQLCIPKILPSKEHIEKMEYLSGCLFTYCNNLEKLLLDFKLSRINDEIAMERYYSLRETTKDYDKDINEIQQKTSKRVWAEACEMREDYLNGMFYEEENTGQNC